MSALLDAMPVAAILSIPAAMVTRQIRRDRRRARYRTELESDSGWREVREILRGRVPDPHDPDTWHGVGLLHPERTVVHETPEHDAAQVCQRCGTPLDLLPAGDAVSHEAWKVTCR